VYVLVILFAVLCTSSLRLGACDGNMVKFEKIHLSLCMVCNEKLSVSVIKLICPISVIGQSHVT